MLEFFCLHVCVCTLFMCFRVLAVCARARLLSSIIHPLSAWLDFVLEILKLSSRRITVRAWSSVFAVQLAIHPVIVFHHVRTCGRYRRLSGLWAFSHAFDHLGCDECVRVCEPSRGLWVCEQCLKCLDSVLFF